MAPSFDDANSLFNFVVREGNGVKGIVDSGLLKVPNRYIQPPHERINKLEAGKSKHPPIDMSELDGPNHQQVAKEIVNAAETLGFFQVVNHGMPVELLESVKDTAHNFFAQPPEKKVIYQKGVSPTPLVRYGTSFAPEKEKALEWKDYISMIYTSDDDALQFWPQECKEVALEYMRGSVKLVKKLLQILMRNLGITLDESRVTGLTGSKLVNINFYPKCPNPELTIGVGRHSDMGTLTALLQDGIGGLYVKVEDEEFSQSKGKWLEIPPIQGALVINIGDALQILSNGKYKSAEHKVLTTNTQSRVSIPVFVAPAPMEKIAPLPQVVKTDGVARYREVVFQDYMNNFFGNAHEGKKSLDFVKIT